MLPYKKSTALQQERNDGKGHLFLWYSEYGGLSSGVSSLLLQKVVTFPYTLHYTHTEAGTKGFKLN